MVFAQPAVNLLDTKVAQSEQRSGPAGVTNDTNHLKLESKKEFCTYLVASQKTCNPKMLSARFELAIFRVSGERIGQLSHESELIAQFVTIGQTVGDLYITPSR